MSSHELHGGHASLASRRHSRLDGSAILGTHVLRRAVAIAKDSKDYAENREQHV